MVEQPAAALAAAVPSVAVENEQPKSIAPAVQTKRPSDKRAPESPVESEDSERPRKKKKSRDSRRDTSNQYEG